MGAIEHTVTGVAPLTAASRASVKVSAATAANANAAAVVQRVSGQYTVSANDVTSLALGGATGAVVIAAFPSTTEPVVRSIAIRTAAGVCKSAATVGVTADQFNTNFWGVKVSDPGAVIGATDIVFFEIEL
jgi:phage portal protein BeeE